MDFKIEKYVILIIRKRKRKTTKGTELHHGKKENYKYVGILKVDSIKRR